MRQANILSSVICTNAANIYLAMALSYLNFSQITIATSYQWLFRSVDVFIHTSLSVALPSPVIKSRYFECLYTSDKATRFLVLGSKIFGSYGAGCCWVMYVKLLQQMRIYPMGCHILNCCCKAIIHLPPVRTSLATPRSLILATLWSVSKTIIVWG